MGCNNNDLLTKDTLDRPYYGVEHFLEKIKGEYTMIDKGYRVFIQKI
jgi:hypothetical protein